MKMSTKGRYAVRILLSIARYQHMGPVPKKIIAAEEGISADYIEQIIVPLKNDGLVVGIRGVKGGFKLAKDPVDITVYDILAASEGVMKLVDCEQMDCTGRDKNKCATRPVWEGASQVLKEYFEKITLKELIDRAVDFEKCGAASYSI
ncbi:RrF2 family transcriptional regulator [Tichowtungia aerotolerans]|uniref:Rrf2 family transcriptional regulator n=1 Tax=Tichowtungia aerotolerans TaxID=2697043 RepID=A0A6P1M1I9_9BACT|nr:Rrf2 family transcriptional regulator [Tichowtungia aerotolerans]QHI67972.1 Rrf2 family transcriptional regulator [Tichowtungia aerotolerans]